RELPEEPRGEHQEVGKADVYASKRAGGPHTLKGRRKPRQELQSKHQEIRESGRYASKGTGYVEEQHPEGCGQEQSEAGSNAVKDPGESQREVIKTCQARKEAMISRHPRSSARK